MVQDLPTNDFLYPISPRGPYRFEEGGRSYETSLAGFREMTAVERFAPCQWRLASNFRRIKGGDRIWVYFAAPTRQVQAVGVARDAPHFVTEWGAWAVWIEWNKMLTEQLQSNPIDGVVLGQKVLAAVTTAGPSARSALRRWLSGHQTEQERKTDNEVRMVRREVNQRLGQPEFRADLRRAYDDTCAITGTRATGVLEAAHITPVAVGGKHALSNGLLLRADIHTLFDLGLITVDDQWRICVDPSIEDWEYRQLDGQEMRLPSSRSDRPSLAALSEQRRRVLNNRD